jgi:hypothetical protein
MGKYSSYGKQEPAPKRNQIHPLMRGIGCVMMVLIPILSYGAAILLVDYGAKHGWPIPPAWLGTPEMHPLLQRVQGLAVIAAFLQRQPNLVANLVFAFGIAVLIGGLMAVIYGYIYTIFGPPKYGPTDAPPSRVKVKPYKR